MADTTSDVEQAPPGHLARPSRSRVFKEVLSGLSAIPGIHGGLLVTADGLIVTTDLPARSQTEALAALGATLGRELELGAGRLGRGAFRTAFFSGDAGTLFVGGSPVGFLILSGDKTADALSVRVALSRALDHIQA